MQYETQRKNNLKAEEKMFPWKVIVFKQQIKGTYFFQDPNACI